MTPLYLDRGQLATRAALCAPGAAFAELAASLGDDLVPVLARPVWLPREKAELTRVGGTCPRDGARLRFDPFAPRAHRCPTCATVYDRDEDYRWWIMGYQLWLAERAVHAATLDALARAGSRIAGAGAFDTFAAAVLDAQADAYLAYPNTDNVLGPTRPFFSTYLESLWLLHVCTALDLLVGSAPERWRALADRVRAHVIEPSRALIASYPEGRSNRQVWNAVARLAASRTLDDPGGALDAVHGRDGIASLMRDALLADGSWFEGDNYHQFAHRGLWYGLRMAEAADLAIESALVTRFRLGYAVPFRVALPDDTLPARRDSQYAVSLRQWRWAEWCELGRADAAPRTVDAQLGALYAACDPELPHATGRAHATGESERNEPASTLSRRDLGWKSLLFALPDLPAPTGAASVGSVLLPEQGYAVLRRAGGRVYAALDYGGGGGGHGHPDRLNVILQDGSTRWLDDPGTGTYVERALHWYRSTLAHAAPLIDGRSQPAGARGSLVGFVPGAVDGDAFAAVAARADLPPVRLCRTLVASSDYVVDLLASDTAGPCTLDLPLSVDGEGDTGPWREFDPRGGGGLEDGFAFVRNAQSVVLGADPLRLALRESGAMGQTRAALWLHAPGATLWRAVAPGPPGTGERRLHVVRTYGGPGAVLALWDLQGTIAAVRVPQGGDAAYLVDVHRLDGTRDSHAPSVGLRAGGRRAGDRVPASEHWRIRSTTTDGIAREQTIDLAATSERSDRLPCDSAARSASTVAVRPLVLVPDAPPLRFALGESHYLRSEASWREAGEPRAEVAIALDAHGLALDVDVHLGRAPGFLSPGTSNRLDNERADVNSDGLQLLIADADGTTVRSWLLVPEAPGPHVRQTATTPDAQTALDTYCELRATGWRIHVRVPRDLLGATGTAFALELAVNERQPARERRGGQLQLSGARGAFVYLRGDRLDVAHALRFLIAPTASAL